MSFVPGLLPRKASGQRHALMSSPSIYYPPKHIDRRPELLAASNQWATSRCVAYAIAGWMEYYHWKNKGDPRQIDPDPIYARAKQIDSFPNEEGTSLEAGLQAAQDLGLMLPVSGIREVQTALEVKQALHRYGVVFAAFNATDLWSDPTADGWMKPNGNPVGGHAVLLCGFAEQDFPQLGEPPHFALQNSWGENIGWRGFVRMSPEQFAQEFNYGLVWE